MKFKLRGEIRRTSLAIFATHSGGTQVSTTEYTALGNSVVREGVIVGYFTGDDSVSNTFAGRFILTTRGDLQPRDLNAILLHPAGRTLDALPVDFGQDHTVVTEVKKLTAPNSHS